MGPHLDGTTRYLCAAVHLDDEFCDKAVAEFLVEPVRAIPPSPGVDSAAVLREAVAAQTRRRIRDAILLALLLIFIVTNLVAALVWAIQVGVVAMLLAVTRPWRTVMNAVGRSRSDPRQRWGVRLLVVLVIGGQFPFFLLLGPLLGAEVEPNVGLFPITIWSALLLGSLILIVLMVDEFTVAKLMTSSFRRSLFDPEARRAPSEWERLVRSLGGDSFRAGLHRMALSDESSQPAGQADVIVYRDYSPFIGAGDKVEHHVIALPLEPSDDENGNPAPINVNDLHRHVVERLATLRSPSSLSPGRRLEQLRHREQVVMPADRLLFNQSAQMQPPVLPDLLHPPLAHLPLGVARALADNPLEWARYYSCFRVESWDRDLITSCYLHIGTDQRMLYLEWTYCVLLPVSERYRAIDRVNSWMPFLHGLFEAVLLPASVVRRLRSAFRRHTVLPQRPGEVIPERYGAAKSLRELAADKDAQTYFQEVDVERYISIIDRALFRAVGQFLEQQGYSVVEFARIAESVVNNFIQGDVINSAIGKGNVVTGNSARVNTGSPDATKGAE